MDRALKDSYQDAVTKQRYFSTPLALAATLRSAKRTYSEMDGNGNGKGKNKGKGKGRGKSKNNGQSKGRRGRGNGGAASCKAKTSDGQMICFDYNSNAGCDRQQCRFLHVCGVCFKEHPMHQCPGGN